MAALSWDVAQNCRPRLLRLTIVNIYRYDETQLWQTMGIFDLARRRMSKVLRNRMFKHTPRKLEEHWGWLWDRLPATDRVDARRRPLTTPNLFQEIVTTRRSSGIEPSSASPRSSFSMCCTWSKLHMYRLSDGRTATTINATFKRCADLSSFSLETKTHETRELYLSPFWRKFDYSPRCGTYNKTMPM